MARVYCLSHNLFGVGRVFEYVFGGFGVVASDPFYLFAEPEGGLGERVRVFVPVCYGVWPRAGVFPRVGSFGDVVEGVVEAASRVCGLRGPVGACRNVVFSAVPCWGVFGGWEFRFSPGDLAVFVLRDVLGDLRGGGGEAWVVLGCGEASWEHVFYHAVVVAARSVGAGVRVFDVWPRPVPARRGDVVVVEEVGRLGVGFVGGGRGDLLVVRRPVDRRVLRGVERVNRLFRERCGSGCSVEEFMGVVGEALDAFYSGVVVSKRMVGGSVVPAVSFSIEGVLGALSGCDGG